MVNPPKTLDAARYIRYGVNSGDPMGKPYKYGFCSYRVHIEGGWGGSHQCTRRNGKGIGGLYCGQHAKQVES